MDADASGRGGSRRGTAGDEVEAGCRVNSRSRSTGAFKVHRGAARDRRSGPTIAGEFYAPVAPDECYWTLEDNAYVSCFLQKLKDVESWTSC